MERYEINRIIENFSRKINDLETSLNPDKLNKELKQLNEKMQAVNFWNDLNEAKKVGKQANLISEQLSNLNNIKNINDEIIEWFKMSEENTDEWIILEEEIKKLEKQLNVFEIKVLLSGQYDFNNAILEIHSGAGGTEAQDWAEMLFRMYHRYAVNQKYKFEILDMQSGDEAGIKSVSISIKGEYAYGYLKAERGVHRLVRISPFDSNSRRHTSFASVEVMPEIDESITVEINDDDLKIDVYRSSGAGGQSVNTTDSAVRITHIPTGIIVSCQNERSQIKNRETALKMLKSKLIQEEVRKKEEKLQDIKGDLKNIAWGSQIRSYVFHPYQMVKDHRTNFETSQISDVINGDIDGFIFAYLKAGGK